MNAADVLSFLEKLIIFYEQDNQILLSSEPFHTLKKADSKKTLQGDFDVILNTLIEKQAYTQWMPQDRQKVKETLQLYKKIAALNEAALRALVEKQKTLFYTLCHAIKKSHQPTVYGSKVVLQKRSKGPLHLMGRYV